MATATGDLLAVARKGTSHTLGGDVVRFTSTDDGATWSAETVIYNAASNGGPAGGPTLLANGDLIYGVVDGTSAWLNYTQTSTDDGATWGSAVAVPFAFTGWSYLNGPIVQLANGDLLASAYGLDSGGVDGTDNYCRVVRSTDSGATWSSQGVIVATGTLSRVWYEPCMLLLPDGTLLCSLRSDTGVHGIYLAKSTDSGATWSTPVRVFDGSGRPDMHIASDGSILMLYRRQVSAAGESAVRRSTDDGDSWGRPLIISTSRNVYGSFVNLGADVGVFYGHEASLTDSAVKFALLT